MKDCYSPSSCNLSHHGIVSFCISSSSVHLAPRIALPREERAGGNARRSGREPSGETLGIALLDSDVFRESTGDLSDVRIFDGSETEARLVPF